MSDRLKTYRVICFDAVLNSISVDEVEAGGDEDIVARVSSGGYIKCEIWDGRRMVASLESQRQTG